MQNNAAKQGELIIAYSYVHQRNMSKILVCLEGEARRSGEHLYRKLLGTSETSAYKIAERILREAKVIKFKHEEGIEAAVKKFLVRQQEIQLTI